MIVVIAGSRGLTDAAWLDRAMSAAAAGGVVPTLVLSGGEPTGADRLGELWADANGIPYQSEPAKWDDLDAPGAVVRRSRSGRLYNAKAGHDRNEIMASRADAGVLLWADGSPGTADMIRRLRRHGRIYYVETNAGGRDWFRPPPPAATLFDGV